MLRVISNSSETNRMNAANLAVVLGPNLLFNSDALTQTSSSATPTAATASNTKDEYSMVHSVIKVMIENQDQLFQASLNATINTLFKY